jgi:hypothetical protein
LQQIGLEIGATSYFEYFKQRSERRMVLQRMLATDIKRQALK